MKILTKSGALDIAPDSSIPIERTNPLLSEQGSSSLSYTIKGTARNMLLMGNPDLYEQHGALELKQDVQIHLGSTVEKAAFDMTAVGEDIEGVFLLNESSFYAQIKEVKLPAVFEGIERWFQPKKELSETERASYVSHILNMLENMIRSKPDYSEDFTVFPAASDCEFTSRTLWGIIQGTTTNQNVINEVYTYYEPGTHFSEIRLKAKEAYEYTDEEDNLIRIPAGYGVSPFLRFGYVLRKIFEHFELKLEPTIFETEAAFRRFVVVNNTQDAVMPGYFIESQLVPDCTVNDFLDIIRKGMCGDFIIDYPNKTARLVFFKDVVNAPPDADLTEYITSRFEKIEFARPKQVRLSAGKSLPHAETATETLEEFGKKYSTYNPLQPVVGGDGVFPFYDSNTVWKISEPIHEWLVSTYKMDFISSMNFDYFAGGDIEAEEHAAPFELPVTIPVITPSDFTGYRTMIIGTLRNLNSHVILDGVKQTEDAAECPIIMAIENAAGDVRYGTVNADTYDSSLVIGPHYPFFTVNTPSMLISLNTWSENGLFNRFWKEYDTLLRKSFHAATYTARMPAGILQNFTFDKLKLINGQPLIPVSLKYEMTDEPLIEVEMLFKTVKKYGMEESSNPEPDLSALNYFIGKWSMAANPAYPDSQLNIQMNEDYSGTLYIKYKNWINLNVEHTISFYKASVRLVTDKDKHVTYQLLELLAAGADNIQLFVVNQSSGPVKSFKLLNEELPVTVRQV